MAGRNESFFHGTVHDIGVGRHVLPARAAGKKNKPGSKGYAKQRSDEHAYAAEDEAKAWEFANHRAMNSRLQASEQGHGAAPAAQRARVYEVAPHPMMRKGVYHPDHPKHSPESGADREWIAPQYKITGVHDTMPGHQGTFPNINWNQFATVSGLSDANHPNDEEVELGHAFSQSPSWRAKNDADLKAQIASRRNPPQKEVRGQLSLFPHPDERR